VSGGARGKEGIARLFHCFGVHSSPIVASEDAEAIPVQILDDDQIDVMGTGLDRVLDHVEDVQREFAHILASC
jgi:hypothetical protein